MLRAFRRDRSASRSLSPPGGQTFEQITADDLANVDQNSQQLIRSLERSMQVSFDRWTERWPDRLARDPNIRQRAIADLREIKRSAAT